MAKVQKVYTKEFQQEAVRLAQTSGKAIAQVARELGISDTSIHQWRKELAENGAEAFPGKGHQMGHRYHVYPDNSRMALFSGDSGSVFASDGGMVNVHQLR